MFYDSNNVVDRDDIERVIEDYVTELNQKKGGFNLEIRCSGLSWDFIAYLQKVNFREVEKRSWLGKKRKRKIREYEPVMSIEVFRHESSIHIYYIPKWKEEAEGLEKRIKENVKLIESEGWQS